MCPVQNELKLPEKDITIREYGENVNVRDLFKNNEMNKGYFDKIHANARYVLKEYARNKDSQSKAELTLSIQWMFASARYFFDKKDMELAQYAYEETLGLTNNIKELNFNIKIQSNDVKTCKEALGKIYSNLMETAIENKDYDKVWDIAVQVDKNLDETTDVCKRLLNNALAFYVSEKKTVKASEMLSWDTKGTIFTSDAKNGVLTLTSKQTTTEFNEYIDKFKDARDLGNVNGMQKALFDAGDVKGLTKDQKKELAKYWLSFATSLNEYVSGVSSLSRLNNYGIAESSDEKDIKNQLSEYITSALNQVEGIANEIGGLSEEDMNMLKDMKSQYTSKQKKASKPVMVRKPKPAPWENRKITLGLGCPDVRELVRGNDYNKCKKAISIVEDAYEKGAPINYNTFVGFANAYMTLYSDVDVNSKDPDYVKARKLLFNMAGELLSTVKDLNVTDKYHDPAFKSYSGLNFILDKLSAAGAKSSELIPIKSHIKKDYVKAFNDKLADNMIAYYTQGQIKNMGTYGVCIKQVQSLDSRMTSKDENGYKKAVKLIENTINSGDLATGKYHAEAQKLINALSQLSYEQYKANKGLIKAIPPPQQVDDYLADLSAATGVKFVMK